ncbi:nitrite reductase small subunit NirD [Oerskovia sp. NPDC060287]|uniref:nitrite reductase small subunit NirD n=1 Tax=Oerskovia sp. NPDC060287 TaxID=3347095 RepID=UPI00365856F0
MSTNTMGIEAAAGLPEQGEGTGADTGTVWEAVCRATDLAVERGAAALVDGQQVALFRLTDGRVLAVQQVDPFSGANVMSRGIVGTRAGVPTVASPMYKQVFALETGVCLDPVGFLPVLAAGPDLATWPVEVRGGVVHVARPAHVVATADEAAQVGGARGAAGRTRADGPTP